MGQPTSTRPLAAPDLDAILVVDRAITGRPRREFYARRLRAVLDAPGSAVALAAIRDGVLVGFAFAHVLDGEFGGRAPVGVLDAIGVGPGAQRRGVARALLGAVEAELGRRGVRGLRTQAEWAHPALTSFFSACGFRLAPRLVLERDLAPPGDDGAGWEDLPVRSMTERDLPAIIRCDRKITGHDRTAYYARKAAEVLRESAVRVSLVAEVQGALAGFLMARVDFGEFGRAEPTAVLDTIGVDPDHARTGVGAALLEQLVLNLASLRTERVVTEVDWKQVGLLAFLARTGFAHSQRLAFEKALA